MSIPAGLKFSGRIATDGERWYFVCGRTGHKRLERVFASKADAEDERTSHDAELHSDFLQRHGIATSHRAVQLGEACDAWLKHVETLHGKGRRHIKTLRHYRQRCGDLVRGLGKRQSLSGLIPRRISDFIEWSFANTTTGGATIIKNLTTLTTVMRFHGFQPRWTIAHFDIRPRKNEHRDDLDTAKIRRFLHAMPAGSLERVYCALKFVTFARDVELRELRVKDVNLRGGYIGWIKHAKRKTKLHFYPLTDDLVDALRPFVADKTPEAWVFTIEGRQLQETSLRCRFLKATKAANEAWTKRRGKMGRKEFEAGLIEPPIRSVSQLRHEAATSLEDDVVIEEISDAMAHESTRTTKIYILNKQTEAAIRRKVEARKPVAEALARMIG